MPFRHDDAAEENYMPSRKAFVRKVREIDVAVNWSISMLVVREGC